jgi:hypothetical protein
MRAPIDAREPSTTLLAWTQPIEWRDDEAVPKIAHGLSAVALAFCATAALAQAPVEVPFFFPVAVGGPITKIVDGYAADFEKENPGIKLQADLFRHLSRHRSPRRSPR